MKLDCVLTATTDSELYAGFIPIFIKTWNKLYPGVDVKIILISKRIPDEYLEYVDNIILFEPIDDVLDSFTSQIIRLLYPSLLNYENGVIITDMDMLPMNRQYYTKPIEPFENDKFIYFRQVECFSSKEVAICYNVATPNTWKEIFDIQSIEDIKRYIKLVFFSNTIKEGHGNMGWHTDQQTLFKHIFNWSKKYNNFVCLKDSYTGFNRLDRDNGRLCIDDNIRNKISAGFYSDYHCLRPMSKFSKINYDIFNSL